MVLFLVFAAPHLRWLGRLLDLGFSVGIYFLSGHKAISTGFDGRTYHRRTPSLPCNRGSLDYGGDLGAVTPVFPAVADDNRLSMVCHIRPFGSSNLGEIRSGQLLGQVLDDHQDFLPCHNLESVFSAAQHLPEHCDYSFVASIFPNLKNCQQCSKVLLISNLRIFLSRITAPCSLSRAAKQASAV